MLKITLHRTKITFKVHVYVNTVMTNKTELVETPIQSSQLIHSLTNVEESSSKNQSQLHTKLGHEIQSSIKIHQLYNSVWL